MTLYIEHVAESWYIVDEDNTIFNVWNDNEVTQRKIDNAIKKINKENPEGKEVELKFKLKDMTMDELENSMNKIWESIQLLKNEGKKSSNACPHASIINRVGPWELEYKALQRKFFHLIQEHTNERWQRELSGEPVEKYDFPTYEEVFGKGNK